MTHYITLVLSGAIGSLGFSLLFSIKNKHLLSSLFGGFLTGLVYVIMINLTDNICLQNVIPSIVGTFYCSILAYISQLPISIYTIPAIVPLVPGGNLYYTMSYLVTGQKEEFLRCGIETLLACVGISMGVIIVTVLYSHLCQKN